jgi:AAA domain
MARWPALIHLVGPPAAGKRTVAVALVEEAARRGHEVVLVDNHLVSRPILTLVNNDGTQVLPPEVWPHVHAVHREVLATIEELSPRDWSFVFTNYLLKDKGRGTLAVESVRALATSRGSTYLPVALRCDLDELLRRVPNADRRDHLKWINPDAVRDELERWQVLEPDGALIIDTTSRPPAESATLILDALDG